MYLRYVRPLAPPLPDKEAEDKGILRVASIWTFVYKCKEDMEESAGIILVFAARVSDDSSI
jgi:hypothetical protein